MYVVFGVYVFGVGRFCFNLLFVGSVISCLFIVEFVCGLLGF